MKYLSRISRTIFWKLIVGLVILTSLLYLKLEWIILIFAVMFILWVIYAELMRRLRQSSFKIIFRSIYLAISAVILSIGLKVLIVDFFIVPSVSMEDALSPGDVIIVNKLSYGPKLPQRLIEIPWLNMLFYLNKTAFGKYSKPWCGYIRLSGYDDIRRGDIFVYRLEDMFVVKRCVGLPGDKLAIVNGKVIVDNHLFTEPSTVKNDFVIDVYHAQKFYSKMMLINRHFLIHKGLIGNRFVVNLTYKELKDVRHLPEVKYIRLQTDFFNGLNKLFSDHSTNKWTLNNMGPIIIPKKGMHITLTENNYPIYEKVIRTYETHDIRQENGHFFLYGKPLFDFVFKHNYFFVLGDNRRLSEDSRIKGFVIEKDIVGKTAAKF
ncbi:MAG: signal peptidase I [Flavobacterium sp.]|nr:MAG: signal peptidase I [Flavobacterium sp.]